MKLLIMPNSYSQAESLIEHIDGIIVGLKDFSVNMPAYFSYNEILNFVNLIKKNNKQIFVALNKNMFNKDLKELRKIMIDLDDLKINGLLYYDVSIVNIRKEEKLVTPLVWNQEHLTTNYSTSNFWFEHGAKYTMLSSEITLDEVKEIGDKANAKLMLPIFGYLPMFVSRRHLVKNYLETFNLEDNSKINYIEKEGKVYAIIDDEHGTRAYSHKCLNGIVESLKLNIDYAVLNSFNISDKVFREVVFMYSVVNETNALEFKEKINEMIDTDLGFLYKETVYKVKK